MAETATLVIELRVECPNEDCSNWIDLLDEDDTNGTAHNDDSMLLRQVFPSNGNHDDFKCEEVTCSACKTTFDVKGLEW